MTRTPESTCLEEASAGTMRPPAFATVALALTAWAGAAGCGLAHASFATELPGQAPAAGPDDPGRDTERPAPLARADVRDRIVTLRAPASRARVTALVRALLDAWVRGSLKDISALLTPDAIPLDGAPHPHGSLVEAFNQRLQAHDYKRLEGVFLVRPERIRAFAWEELEAPTSPARPVSMRPGQVYVEAPLEMSRLEGDKLFGKELVLLLEPSPDGLRIAAYGETP